MNVLTPILLTLYLSSFVHAQSKDLADTIDMAGDQSILTQRILKNYCQIGLNVQSRKAKKELSESIRTFESNIKELKQFSDKSDMKPALAKVEKLWNRVKTISTGTVKRENAVPLRTATEQLLASTESVLEILKEGSQADRAQLAHAAKYQGMLAVRMSSLHLLKAWDVQDEAAAQAFQTAMDQFQFTQEELESEAKNTPQITSGLKEVRKRFNRLQKGTQAGTSQFILSMVVSSADRLLDKTHRISRLYSAGMKNGLMSDQR